MLKYAKIEIRVKFVLYTQMNIQQLYISTMTIECIMITVNSTIPKSECYMYSGRD